MEEVRVANGGTLTPNAVVDAATSEESPLHNCFTWDDCEAGKAYRLWQARQLIRVRVVLLPRDDIPDEELADGPRRDPRPIRAYVSLVEDRGSEGYRPVVEVLSDAQRRPALVRQAVGEIAALCKKYEDMGLRELSDIFAAVRAAEESTKLAVVA